MTKKKKISDADLSNAGDDFHVLWTIKKSFELLNFDDKALKAITLENFELNESSKLDETGEKLLGIDLVEYYGGEDLKSADNVVVSQLKYSTRRATEDWSIAKLYKGKKANSYDGSVIHRLATIYKTLLDEWGRDLVLKKLKIKLVSNRNFSESDKKTIDSIQKLLVSKNSKTRFSEIAKSIRLNNVTFEKFQKASKLTSIEFTDFIRLLNFEECGVSSRYFLKLEIINAIRQASMQSTPQYQSIVSLVWNKMMPESNARNKITKEDVLICFDLQIDDLFPVSQKFEKIDNYVLREQLSQILGIIENNQHGVPICIHAGAGMGKSVFTQLIEKNLPDYCESIVFDCYGAGEYLNPADVRHQHKIALLHICNVLAKKLGTSFLLDRNESSEVYLKQLKRRLSSAIDILKKRNSNAYLVLIIDAADNSVTASQKDAAKSFVQDILNMPFPEGAKLIVTTRTHRKELLDLPDGYIDIEINRFSLAETSKHIKYSYPDISEQEILDFHYLTNGIPRVQSYSLDLKKSGISEIINYLKPNGKNVEDLISEKIIEAEKRLGIDGKNLINIFFSYLITLPRPVPLFYLERITKINKEIFIDLATDIWHGLILDNNRFHFRDEDFENYIRGKYQANDTIKKNIADSFFINANIDEYASVNLGNSLYAADYKEKLIDIVLNRKFLALPIDPIRNKEVYIERTKLAMKVSSSDDKNEIFFKLLIIAANEAKTDKALSDLLINNADLAVLFGDNTSIERLNLKSEDKSWGGAFHLRLAAIYL